MLFLNIACLMVFSNKYDLHSEWLSKMDTIIFKLLTTVRVELLHRSHALKRIDNGAGFALMITYHSPFSHFPVGCRDWGKCIHETVGITLSKIIFTKFPVAIGADCSVSARPNEVIHVFTIKATSPPFMIWWISWIKKINNNKRK